MTMDSVRRQTLPPLFFLAGCMWATCAIAYGALQGTAQMNSGLVFGIGACTALAGSGLALRCGLSNPVSALMGVALGLSCAGQGALALSDSMKRADDAGRQPCLFQIVEDVQASDYGLYCIASAKTAEGGSFRVRVNLPQGCAARCWDVFELDCAIRAPSVQSASYYWQKGCVGSVSPAKVAARSPEGFMGAVSWLRARGTAVFSRFEGTGSQFMRSVVFGDRMDLLESPFYDAVKQAGLAHMVAVSGAHVSIAVTALAMLLGRMRWPRCASVFTQVGFCILYVLLTGAPVSAIRACAMAACTLMAFFGRRRGYALNALSLCVVAFLVLQPYLCLSVSFALSALATLGIVLFAEYFGSWFGALVGGRAPGVCSLLGMTCAAIVSTLPVTITLFGQFSLIAPLTNLAATPAFVFLCVGGMASALVGMVAPTVLFPASLVVAFADMFCEGVRAVALFPFAAIALDAPVWILVPSVLAAAVFVQVKWPAPNQVTAFRCLLCVVVSVASILFLMPVVHKSEIVMLDVGQGDAFVIRSGSHVVLVDTGNQDAAVLKGLSRHDVRHLDAVLVTHPDDDHCGSLPAITGFVEVDRVIVAADLIDCPCDNCASLRRSAGSIPLVGVKTGDVLSWGAFAATVLSPKEFSESGGNGDSLVLQVEADSDSDGSVDATALFCGDAESEVIGRLDEAGLIAHSDIYKVGHHGSAGAVTEDQLRTISPSIALVSAGKGNKYGHPTSETIGLLEAAGASVYRTDVMGDVVCRLNGREIAVEHGWGV